MNERWRRQAPCVGQESLFFPSKTDAPGSLQVRRAKRICLTECVFRRECLEACFSRVGKFVVLTGQQGRSLGGDRMGFKPEGTDSSEWGIWGGTTPEERKAVAHLPLKLRIETLLEQVKNVTGPFAAADPEEVVG